MDISRVKNIRIEDFSYHLPDDRIALHPLTQRDSCKLIVRSADGGIRHLKFHDLPTLIPSGTLLICNETKVINARMEFFRPSGGRIEVFVLEPSDPSDYVLAFAANRSCVWECMIGNLKKWKENPQVKEIRLPESDTTVGLRATLLPPENTGRQSAIRRVLFEWDNPMVNFASVIEAGGNIPIPPYLKRASEASDLEDYQTIYSRVEGSVAAPTAGLHFTPELFRCLTDKGVDIRKVTLHVGAGTFQPVKSDVIGEHPMHTESLHVDLHLIESIIDSIEAGREVMAVGTTSVRTIESLPYFGYLISKGEDPRDVKAMHIPQWLAYSDEIQNIGTPLLLKILRDGLKDRGMDYLAGSTSIMIAPGFRWRIINGLITNFHQPESTLLLLVSSFLDRNSPEDRDKPGLVPAWRALYDEALAEGYRFLSYGDACFLR